MILSYHTRHFYGVLLDHYESLLPLAKCDVQEMIIRRQIRYYRKLYNS